MSPRHFTPVAFRLPIGPLLKAARADTITQLAWMLDKPRSRIYPWQRDGLTSYEADHACVKLAMHPAVVWGRAWDDLCDWEDPDAKREWHARDVERANRCIERIWDDAWWEH